MPTYAKPARTMPRAVFLLTVIGMLSVGRMGESAPLSLPLSERLAIVQSYRNAGGDFETIITVSKVAPTGVTLTASTDESTDTCSKGNEAACGASRPTATNHTLEGRARNRRVELVRQ